ncbi:MAG: class I SAM-dependent methyltransferase [Bacteroidales bacterium]
MKTEEYQKDNPFGLETDSDFHRTRRNTTISLVHSISVKKERIKILDVGCGKGYITSLIKEKVTKVDIDAIDISEKAIEIAKNSLVEINFSVADAMIFKGYGYGYDIILLNNIYEHVENPTGMLINLKNYLNDDGVFIISTPNRYYIKNVLRKFFGLKIVIPNYHITEYSIGQIFDHHLHSGLKIRNIILPEFKREKLKLLDIIVFKIIQPIADLYFRLLNSRTRLGSLLFVISSK